MDFYTYGAPGAYDSELCQEEIWREYAECGLNVMFLTGNNSYYGGGWENSQAKKCFDIARNIGVDKVILHDERIVELIVGDDTLVGSGEEYKFQSEAELDAYVKQCMQEYAHEKGLYGIRLKDEPQMQHLKSCGQVYRSVKRVAKDLGFDYFYILMNLLPLVGDYPVVTIPDGKERTITEEYEYYLDAFMKETGADTLAVDNYPFRPRYSGGIFMLGYYSCFQIMRKVCDKYHAKMSFVLQSFEMIHKTKPEATAGFRRITTANEMMLQMNSALGFGVREIAFFTYVTKTGAEIPNYRSADGSAFVTNTGTKTRIYEFAKSAIADAKKLENILFAYDFKGAKLFLHETCNEECPGLYLGGAEFTTLGGTRKGAEFDNSYIPQWCKKITHDRDIMLVTEFEKEGENPHMMMIQNVLDIVYKVDLIPMKATVEFENCNCVKAFKHGEWKEIELLNGIYETELAVGEAVYVIPFSKS